MHMRHTYLPTLRKLAALAAMALTCTARAEDIDVYAAEAGTAALPNVLLILDNSANWSSSIDVPDCHYRENGVLTSQGPRSEPPREQGTKMGIEKCALHNLFDAIPTNADGSARVNVGLMLFNESPAENSGGYPRIAIQPVTAATKSAFKAAIRDLHITNDKGNNAAFAKSLYEAYLYLKNGTPYRGTRGTEWDHAATFGGLAAGPYVTPVANSCGRNYVIFIANGSPGEVTNDEARALLAAVGGNTTQIKYANSQVSNSDQANWADEFARFMNNTDVSTRDGTQAITVHTVAVTGASNDGRYPEFIRLIAEPHGGFYKQASDPEALANALQDLFNTIEASSGVFASASLPISVNSRGTFLNHVFMGMFIPDADSKPRWFGNLKQYQFTYDQVSDRLRLADSRGEPALSDTGFIAPSAVSYWSHSSSFWANALAGTPPSASDSPDGDVVQKGAAAQLLRESILTDQSTRRVFTCISCNNNTALTTDTRAQFVSGNDDITATALGVTESERSPLIEWIRGADNAGGESGPGSPVTARPSVHGDVLHSRPAAVNYGPDIGVVVFYGANDGMLHAVLGNKENNAYGTAGTTLWSFLPQEHFPKLKRLRANSPIIRYPATVSATAVPRDYFVDGAMSVYQRFDADGNVASVQLFVGMRRGGRVLYAFDVTDPNAPVLMWRKSSADIARLGQTWSEPKVAKLRGYGRPVIIMGAGYDPTEDLAIPATPDMGNAVLVLDTQDGHVIHTFTTDRPVPADVALVDSDFDSYVDRAYAADLGGNIYRIDFERTELDSGTTLTGEGDWHMEKLAALGSSGGKKFFYAPDVVVTRNFTVVLAGSGDREKPLSALTQDYFYTVLDRNTAKGLPDGFTTLGFSDLVAQSQFASSGNQNGCYSALATGEKVVNAPITIAGRTYFSTNKPHTSLNACSINLGIAKSYAAPVYCKQPIATELVGGGLPPSPVAGVVQVEYTDPATGETSIKHVPFIIGADPYSEDANGDGINDADHGCNKAIGGCKVSPPVSMKRSKIYWNTENER